MTVSPKHAALAAKLVKMDVDINKHTEELFDILATTKNKTLPSIDEKTQWYRMEDSDKKAEVMENDIKANIKAVNENIFTIRKIALKLIDRAESLERAADHTHSYNGNDSSRKLYEATQRREERRKAGRK